jgi:hypothetical protein
MSISRPSICLSHVSWCWPHLIGYEKCNNRYPKIGLRDKSYRKESKLQHNDLAEQEAATR